MRLSVKLLILMAIFGLQLQASDRIYQQHHYKHKASNDLIPILRVEAVPRFFDDEAALLFLGEYGRMQNRFNGGYGFSMCCDHHFKVGAEVLNQELSYNFQYDHSKAWVKQVAIGGAYQYDLNFWGIKTVEFLGQWSHAQNQHVHDLRKKEKKRREPHQRHAYEGEGEFDCITTTYKRRIAGSKAYAFGAELSLAPWYWASLTMGIVYDKVSYTRQRGGDKIIEGAGATIALEQRFSPCLSAGVRAEYRLPYSYYGGDIKWTTTLYGGDFSLGIFGGHTIGQHRLPNNTVAGIELGFDFGLSNFSETRSAGVCWDSPDIHCQRSFMGQDREYLRWLATPTVYMPEVLALSEQWKVEHHHHPHHIYEHEHHRHRGHRGG